MNIVECTKDKLVFEEPSVKFGMADRLYQFLFKVGCLLPLLIGTFVCGGGAVNATSMGDKDDALFFSTFALIGGAMAWAGWLRIHALARQSKEGLRYTIIRGRTAVIEEYHPKRGLQQADALRFGNEAFLYYWLERIRAHRGTIVRHRVALVQDDGTQALLKAPEPQTLENCLTKLLNISRVTGLRVELEGEPLPKRPTEELPFSKGLEKLLSLCRQKKGAFEYRISASPKNVPMLAWLFFGAFAGLAVASAFLGEDPGTRLTWAVLLGLLTLFPLGWVLSSWRAGEHLIVDGSGFTFQVNGQERPRQSLSHLLELQALPLSDESLSSRNYCVGLFFPGRTDLLFARHALTLPDAQQVVLRIQAVLKEHGLKAPDGPFGASALQT